MAHTIAVISSKGGSGKSTIACGICSVLSMFAPRQRILAVDAGGQQNTLLYLQGCGDYLPNVDVSAAQPDTLAGMADVETGHAFRVVDLPGYARASETDAVLGRGRDGARRGVDLVIVPMLPSQFDLESVTAWVMEQIVPLGVPYGIVLSRVPPRALAEAIDLQRQVQSLNLDAFGTFIRDYRGVQHAQRDRVPITRYGGRHGTERYAEDDFRAITREVTKRVGSRVRIPTRADQAEEARIRG